MGPGEFKEVAASMMNVPPLLRAVDRSSYTNDLRGEILLGL